VLHIDENLALVSKTDEPLINSFILSSPFKREKDDDHHSFENNAKQSPPSEKKDKVVEEIPR